VKKKFDSIKIRDALTTWASTNTIRCRKLSTAGVSKNPAPVQVALYKKDGFFIEAGFPAC